MNFKRSREIEAERWKEEKKGKERKKTTVNVSIREDSSYYEYHTEKNNRH